MVQFFVPGGFSSFIPVAFSYLFKTTFNFNGKNDCELFWIGYSQLMWESEVEVHKSKKENQIDVIVFRFDFPK